MYNSMNLFVLLKNHIVLLFHQLLEIICRIYFCAESVDETIFEGVFNSVAGRREQHLRTPNYPLW